MMTQGGRACRTPGCTGGAGLHEHHRSRTEGQMSKQMSGCKERRDAWVKEWLPPGALASWPRVRQAGLPGPSCSSDAPWPGGQALLPLQLRCPRLLV